MSSELIRSVLVKAREVRVLFGNRENWVNGAPAETKSGLRVCTSDPRACRFCLAGAILKVSGDDTRAGGDLFNRAMALAQARGYWNLFHLNDVGGYQLVLHLLDTLITDLEPLLNECEKPVG